MNTFEEILRTALALPEEQRAILAGRLRRAKRPENQDRPIRLSRLNIFLADFHEARRFADYILTRDLHKFDDPQSKKRLVHLAFNTSLIVTYCRPFHRSNDQKGAPKVSLTKGHLATVLDSCENDFHSRIIAKRDQAFAHSDSIAAEIEGWDYSGKIVMFYNFARDPLTKEETQTLRGMTKKWIEHLEKLREGAGHTTG
jgi:hypothetical protein